MPLSPFPVLAASTRSLPGGKDWQCHPPSSTLLASVQPKHPTTKGKNPTHQPRPSPGKAEFPNEQQLQHQGHLVTHQSDSKKKNANSNSLGQCRALSLAVSQIATLGREGQTPRELMFSHFMQCCLGYNGNKKYFF